MLLNKKIFLLLMLIVPISGCSQIVKKFDENNITPLRLKNIIKSTTMVILTRSTPDKNSLLSIKDNIENIKNNLEQNRLVDFDKMKTLINVPQEYKFIVNTILDVIENYLTSYVSGFLDKNERSVEFVLAGLDGSLYSINHYLQNN